MHYYRTIADNYLTFTLVPSANWFWPLVITWLLGFEFAGDFHPFAVGDAGFDFHGMGFSVFDDKNFRRAHGRNQGLDGHGFGLGFERG